MARHCSGPLGCICEPNRQIRFSWICCVTNSPQISPAFFLRPMILCVRDMAGCSRVIPEFHMVGEGCGFCCGGLFRWRVQDSFTHVSGALVGCLGSTGTDNPHTHLWPLQQGRQTSSTGSGIPQKAFQEVKEQAVRLLGLRHYLVSFPLRSVGDRPATRPARLHPIKSTYGKYYCVHLCENTICHIGEGEGQQQTTNIEKLRRMC